MSISSKNNKLKRAGVSGYNKPKKTPNHPRKSHVVVAKVGDKTKLIRFGQQGVSGAGNNPQSSKQKARRKSFKARHARNIRKGKFSAAYWANKVKWLWLLLMLSSPLLMYSQEFLHDDDFEKKTSQGIVIVEFYASWNDANSVPIKKLSDSKKYRVSMDTDMSLLTKYNVMGVPTVVMYQNGKEIKRWKPNVMMQLDAKLSDIQSCIDELIGDKF